METLKDLPLLLVIPVSVVVAVATRSLIWAKPPETGGIDGFESVIAVHLMYISVCMQFMMPWLHHSTTEPFGLRLVGLGAVYTSILPVFLQMRNDMLCLEVKYTIMLNEFNC